MLRQECQKLKNGLSKTQKASSILSQTWKKQSKLLLDTAVDIKEFKAAVVWCGKGGNVLRTLEPHSVDQFSKYLFGNKSDIQNGDFNLSGLDEFGGKRPLSWTSKILHIMNPKKYPIIYDGNIRKALKIKSLKQFEVKLNEKRDEAKNTKMNDDELYEYDSVLWATQL